MAYLDKQNQERIYHLRDKKTETRDNNSQENKKRALALINKMKEL